MNYWDNEQLRQTSQLWLDMLSKIAAAFTSVQPCTAPSEAARQYRGAIFQAIAEQLDQFMRSDAFLEAMKQSLDRSIQFQKQSQELLTQMHHATQSVAVQDVAAVLSLMRQIEQRMLDRFDDLGSRLDRLENAARATEDNGQAKGVHA